MVLTLIVLSIPGLLSSEDIREWEARGTSNIFQTEIHSSACLDHYLQIWENNYLNIVTSRLS